MQNQLLNQLIENELPPFQNCSAEALKKAVIELLDSNRADINALLNSNKNAQKKITFENIIYPMDRLKDKLNKVFGVASHLNAVLGSDEWRKVYDELLPKVTEYYLEIAQNEQLYQALLDIKQSDQYEQANPEQKKLLDNNVRNFRLAGVNLEKNNKEKLMTLKSKLSDLETRFAHNIIDAKESWSLHITDPKQIQGLPEPILQAMQAKARAQGKEGWLLTLSYACYEAVMHNAEDQHLRKEMYTAYNTVASENFSAGIQYDNGPLIVEILQTRQAIAETLGFKNYAEYALETRMLQHPSEVLNFLEELLQFFKPKAKEELKQLEQFAALKLSLSKVEAWDVAFVSEKLRKETLSFSEEELRSYFPISQVLQGIFAIIKKLYNVNIQELTENRETWHESTSLFAVYNASDELIAKFYLDLYERPKKRAGAWFDESRTRVKISDSKIQIPVAYIVANFRNSALGDVEAHLSHAEIKTLFHEFGHCLHHILSKCNFAGTSSISEIAWDAIELPSQLMENWCFEEEGLRLIISNYNDSKGSAPDIPAELQTLLKKLQTSKNFLIGITSIRQLEFALFDFKIHQKTNIKNYEQVLSLLEEVRQDTSVISVPKFNRFINNFAHIFSGPYAAGYYSYMWSLILSSDVYQHYKDSKDIFNKDVANRFLSCILEQGGSKQFMELFIDFAGRKPKLEAFFAQCL